MGNYYKEEAIESGFRESLRQAVDELGIKSVSNAINKELTKEQVAILIIELQNYGK
jgi:hypothetical protein